MKYVGVGLRAVAIIIDTVILFIVGYMIAALTGGTTSEGFDLSGGPFFIWALIGFAYFIVLEAKMGATLGKMALKLKVVKEDGSDIEFKESILRNILRIIDSFPMYLIGAILVWTSDKKQRLGDRVAKTVVIKKD